MRNGFLVVLVVAAAACSKAPAQAHSAPAPAKAGQQAAAPGSQDTALPSGIDLSKLDDFQKKVFFRIANTEPSICGEGQSLIKSAKGTCRRSWNGLRYVSRLVEQGYTDSEVSEALEKRYRQSLPKAIDVVEAPVKGNPRARVTLVEFSDYECPHCKRLQMVLHQVVEEFRNDVRLYFKHYPLPQHTNARIAAEAAVAAQKQGKFWEFSDKVFNNQDDLSQADLEKYAKEVGLDMTKFRQDAASPAVKARVQKDRVDGTTLGLSATPALYIDGREYTDPRDTESLREWIKEALGK